MIIIIYFLILMNTIIASKPYICLDDDSIKLYKFGVHNYDCKLKIKGYTAIGSLWDITNIEVDSVLFRVLKFECKYKNKFNMINILFDTKININFDDISNTIEYNGIENNFVYIQELDQNIKLYTQKIIGCTSDYGYGYYISKIDLLCALTNNDVSKAIYINECRGKNNKLNNKISNALENIILDINRSTNIKNNCIRIGSNNYYMQYCWDSKSLNQTFDNKQYLTNDYNNLYIYPYTLLNNIITFEIYPENNELYYNAHKYKYYKYNQFLRLYNDNILKYLITYPIDRYTINKNKTQLSYIWFNAITNLNKRHKRDIIDNIFDGEIQFIKDTKFDENNKLSNTICNELIIMNNMLNGICNSNVYYCLTYILKRQNFKANIINNILQIKECRIVDSFDLKLIEHNICYIFPFISYTINNISNIGFINLATNEIMAESIITNDCPYNRYIEIDNEIYYITINGLTKSNINITYITDYKNISIEKKNFDIIDDFNNLREKLSFPKFKDIYHTSIDFINYEIASYSAYTKYNNRIALDISSPFSTLSNYIRNSIIKICIIIFSIIILIIIIKIIIKTLFKYISSSNKPRDIEMINLNQK
ncbi:putative glycoprotein B [Alphaentomopoxvirus acuprea]|uniref:Putative glycoprotein B n=1 Tax=Alphaentomopoxvirus acuprea TaxID=62099 RepID=W6JIZ4_9POXV|nr:putative glycoprotein B [Anomala cuprea entomopoxvirus]BAO49583.1 putative glycoprotein B [Anomala cuprea entomopoxvirus]